MKVLSLFAGIGGFDLGLERAGMTVVGQCEIDPFCRAVLKKHWPDVPQYEDIRTLKGEQVGPVDLVCGGYPCQPFSTAGKRGGAEDDRHLWPEMRRLVEELRPAWVIGENVAGHITLGLDQVLSDLDALGYASRAFVIPAVAVDARHRRARVWIVAHSDRGREPQQEGFKRKGGGWVGNGCKVVADAFGERGRSGDRQRQDAIHAHPCRGTIGPGRDGSRWATEPDVGRVAHGVAARVDRLKAIGNGQVPLCAATAFELLRERLEK